MPKTPSTDPAPYRFRGGARRLLHSQAREIVLSGPAGTGKTMACLSRLFYCCAHRPNVRCLIVRKTRESLNESALVTWEQQVLPAGHESLSGQQRRTRQNYTFGNGSVVVVGGMDKASKIMSTEYDLIYVQEAIELTEEDWDALLTRLRNGKLPLQQLLADTNPDTPQHWIRQRSLTGQLLLIDSQHEDNPRWFDGKNWTQAGAAYIDGLNQLTGPRLQRLRFGRWVGAEGAVYEEFSRAVHVVNTIAGCEAQPEFAQLPPAEWKRYLAIDFGYTNAFVCLWGAVDPDGRVWIYRQLVRTQTLVEDHAKLIQFEMQEEERQQRHRIVQQCRVKEAALGEVGAAQWMVEAIQALPRQLKPQAVICDHDAEDRATLERHLGMKTKAANKAISPGIQAVASRLRVQDDGKPRLLITASSVLARDAKMEAKKLPVGLAEEMEGYVWNTEGGRRKGEEPLGLNDHCCDSCRYLVSELDVNVKRKVQVFT
jgi:phage terminase large subunit